jgi:pimeloyl-ACP methyl ester carboxylesterase
MRKVVSADGTPIAYDRQGRGPAVILVGGALVDPATGRAGRWENAPLAGELAPWFTVYNYDRRGRAESGDTPPYALARELEDLEALITEAGGSAYLHGVSSGGALALEAAAAGLAVGRIAVYEIPWNLADDWPPRWRDYRTRLAAYLADGRRGAAVEAFLRIVDSAGDDVAAERASPYWAGMEALAHTLAYDAECLGDGRPPAGRLARITQPTLVATGAGHPTESPEWVRALDPAADMVAASVPGAARRVLAGQGHVVEPETLASVLARFFAG